MNQQNRRQVGNFVLVRMLTATQVGYPDSEEHLAQILNTFNRREILMNLARINLLLQCSEDFSVAESILEENFCSDFLYNEIDKRDLIGNIIFNREATLRLLSKSASLSDPHFSRAPNIADDARHKLTRCYLIANKIIGTNLPDFGTDFTEGQRKELLAALIPSAEYAINSSPGSHIKYSLVRSKDFLACIQAAASTFDLNEIFSQATGLTLQDYQYLILRILSVSLSLSTEEILEGIGLLVDTKPSPVLTPLYDKLLPHICIPINEFVLRAEMHLPLPNEFRLWRKYPPRKNKRERDYVH